MRIAGEFVGIKLRQSALGQIGIDPEKQFDYRSVGTADPGSDIDVAAFLEHADRRDLRLPADLGAEVRRLVGDDVEWDLFAAESLADPPKASPAQLVVQHGVSLDIADFPVPLARSRNPFAFPLPPRKDEVTIPHRPPCVCATAGLA